MSHGDDSLPTASLHTLRQRSQLLVATREFFARHGYWEVETPLLSHDSCVDQWLDPFLVPLPGNQNAWLQTSPEFGMKRLMAAGADRIFQITRSFRRDESGPRHNCEFTILEWYARGEDHFEQMNFVEQVVHELAAVAARECPVQTGVPICASGPFLRVTYEDAFLRSVGCSPLTASVNELQAAVARVPAIAGQANTTDRDALCNLLLAERVEPDLARERAVFLHAYPASQAALARIDPGPPSTAERFELYLDGIEICNGYHELTDAEELAERMREQNRRRLQSGLPPLPEESLLLSAMRNGFPACSGVALGFDRLVMWCLGRKEIREVIPFPFDRA